MMKIRLITIALSLFTSTMIAQVTMADSMALVTIYDSTDGTNWTKQENWLNGPVGSWQGITIADGRVTKINLQLAGLEGSVPDAIFTLDGLKEITLRESKAQIDLDQRMEQWENLEWISMSGGMISADLEVLCNMQTVHSVSFFNMNLGGEIPDCFQNLPLRRLNLNGANLDSALLPEFIGQIPTLSAILLSNNQFYGPIPNSFCGGGIQFLDLGNNLMTGMIPNCLDTGNLVQLFLDGNQMEGEVPVEILSPSLTIMDLCDNQFTGDVSLWPDLPEMDRLKLEGNQFAGTFDGSILKSSNFRILDLSNNAFDQVVNFPSHDLISQLVVTHNNFDFTDLENLVPNNSNFKYAPQQDIGEERTENRSTGESFDLSMDAGGMITTHQWYKDAVAIEGATSSTFSITSVESADAGRYHCQASHDSFPDLTLKLAPVTLELGTTGIQNVFTDQWLLIGNPGQHQIFLRRSGSGTMMAQPILRVLDETGRILVERKVDQLVSDIRISVANYAPGVYYVQMNDQDHFGSWRFMKVQ